jgi:hypothetical protein
MLYDLAYGPPDPGSPLESVLLLVTKKRQEARFLETRAMMEAFFRPHTKDDTFSDALKDYVNALFPYVAKEREARKKEEQRALKEWTSVGALKVRPLWMAKDQRRQIMSRMQLAQKRAEAAERRWRTTQRM